LGFELLEKRVLLSADDQSLSFDLALFNSFTSPEETGSGAIIDAYDEARYRPEVAMVGFYTQSPQIISPNGSGTFITRQDVLTAAHVVDRNKNSRWDSADAPFGLFVRTSRNADVREPGFVEYRVIGVTIHPQYRYEEYPNGNLKHIQNDVAIIHLETMSDVANPVPIFRGTPRVEQVVEAVGFGRTGSRFTGGEATPNGYVRYRGFGMLDSVPQGGKTISWDLDQEGESGIAPGDSGGPSFVVVNGNRHLAGVHSYGSKPPNFTGARSTDMRVDVYASWIDQVLAATASRGPTATVERHDDITSAGSVQYNLRIKYSDVNGIAETDLARPHIALIGPNNYYNQYPKMGLVIRSTDGAFLTVDYRFDGPGGAWSTADNGRYQVVLLNRGITDTLGNPVGGSIITSFNVSLPADTAPPIASGAAQSKITPGKPNFTTEVLYSDNFGIDGATLGDDDVRLVKTDGTYNVAGRLMLKSRDAKGMWVPYEFAAPGGAWDASDNGTYQIVVRPGSVRDVSGNAIAGTTIATLTVNIPIGAPVPPWAILTAANVTSETNTHTFTITYYDDSAVSVASILDNRSEVFVQPLNSAGDFATLVGVSQNGNGSPIVATYRFTGTRWRAADNGISVTVSHFAGGISGTVTDASGNVMGGGPLGGFQIRLSDGPPDTVAPVVSVSAANVTLAGGQSHPFSVLLTDDQAVAATSITSDSLLVLGPGQQQYPVQIDSINYGQDVPAIVASFTMEPPGGSWDISDNGVYRIAVRNSAIQDANGNAVSGYDEQVPMAGMIGSFVASIGTTSEALPPRATLQATGITVPKVGHTFAVTYSGEVGIDLSSLGNDDVYVGNQNGGELVFAEYLGAHRGDDGRSTTAFYRATKPGGSWTQADNGIYDVFLAGEEAGLGVRTETGSSVPRDTLGSFAVSIDVAMNNMATVHSVPSHVTTERDTPVTIGGIVVRETNAAVEATILTLHTTHGTLSAESNSRVLVLGNATSNLTLVLLPNSADPSELIIVPEVIYQPALRFSGDDEVSVLAADESGYSSPLPVTIPIHVVSDAPALPGDYNKDGMVDAADYVVWRKTSGNNVPDYTGADGNGDGTIGQEDHGIWTASFGRNDDDHGNNASDATIVSSMPSTRSGHIGRGSDVDWFRFTALAGNSYFFETTLAGLTSSALRLMGSDGATELAIDDDGGPGFINWIPTETGEYYLEVRGLGGGTGNYELGLRDNVPFGSSGKILTRIGAENDAAKAVTLQSDGKILVAGTSYNGQTSAVFALARYNEDGFLDETFDGDGKLTMPIGEFSDANSVAIQGDGKIVVAGSSFGFTIARFNSDGSPDTTFDGDGQLATPMGVYGSYLNALAIQGDGKIVAVGSVYNGLDHDFALARYNFDGSPDMTFDGDGTLTIPLLSSSDAAYGVAIQGDGKIVVTGTSSYNLALLRFNTDGSPDTTFDGDGKLTAPIGFEGASVAIQGDGKIVVAGTITVVGSGTDFTLARFNSDGSPDMTFDGDGNLTTAGVMTEIANSVALQGDGEIVVAGYAYNSSSFGFAVARYNSDGSPDATFDDDGKLSTELARTEYYYGSSGLVIQGDGKIIVAGSSWNGTDYDFALARYMADGSLDAASVGAAATSSAWSAESLTTMSETGAPTDDAKSVVTAEPTVLNSCFSSALIVDLLNGGSVSSTMTIAPNLAPLIPAGGRVAFEPTQRPARIERDNVESLGLRVAEPRDIALAALVAIQSGSEGADKGEVVGEFHGQQNESLAVDAAIASWGLAVALSGL
jgi:uncharacterized delta-60 repeat protein